MFKQAQKPQISEGESRELTHDSYVLYTHNHLCDACGAIERFSQCFEVWLHPTKTRISGLRDLRPVVHGPLNVKLAMACISVPERRIPICIKCVWTHHNKRGEASPTPISNAAWADTLKRKYAAPEPETKIATKSAAPAKAVPTLDQI